MTTCPAIKKTDGLVCGKPSKQGVWCGKHKPIEIIPQADGSVKEIFYERRSFSFSEQKERAEISLNGTLEQLLNLQGLIELRRVASKKGIMISFMYAKDDLIPLLVPMITREDLSIDLRISDYVLRKNPNLVNLK
jgi:hypothetical protein